MKTKLTVEESQRLIELGVDPDLASATRYTISETEEYCGYERKITVTNGYIDNYLSKDRIFTLADILNILPKEIIADTIMGEDFPCALAIKWDENRKEWYCAYECLPHPLNVGKLPELIDALYQLLIWAIENGYVKPNKDN